MNKRILYKSEAARATVLAAYEDALAAWSSSTGAVPERLSLATGSGRTAVLAFGTETSGRSPLLLLHGTLSNSSMWQGEVSRLARDRRVYAVDIPGEPGFSEEKAIEWKPEAGGTWLADLVAALGLGEHDILGCSIGGWFGLAYAARKPRELRALALLSPSGIGRTRGSFMLKAMLAAARGRAGTEALSRSLYGDRSVPAKALIMGMLNSEATNPRLEKPWLFGDEELGRIGARLFLAVGEKDVMLRSEESAARLGRIQGEAEIHLLPGAGHVLLGIGDRLVEFLDK